MKKYAVCDGNTIARTFTLGERDALPEGVIAIEVPMEVSSDTYYMVNDVPTPKPPVPVQGRWDFDSAIGKWCKNSEQMWWQVRHRRDGLLTATDWVVLRAQESGSEVPVEWTEYRQALRDITNQPDPFNITWPTAPQ